MARKSVLKNGQLVDNFECKNKSRKYIKSITQLALREDLSPSGDITSKNIINKKVTTKIVAGQKLHYWWFKFC